MHDRSFEGEPGEVFGRGLTFIQGVLVDSSGAPVRAKDSRMFSYVPAEAALAHVGKPAVVASVISDANTLLECGLPSFGLFKSDSKDLYEVSIVETSFRADHKALELQKKGWGRPLPGQCRFVVAGFVERVVSIHVLRNRGTTVTFDIPMFSFNGAYYAREEIAVNEFWYILSLDPVI
jgi:hypothetical protein